MVVISSRITFRSSRRGNTDSYSCDDDVSPQLLPPGIKQSGNIRHFVPHLTHQTLPMVGPVKMGGRRCCKCTARTFLLTICSLQLISSIERQVFDFLGQMWGPILFNFFSTIFTLIGMFGVYYRRVGHLSLFTLWQIVSISWNAFVIGIYLQIPPLHQESSSDLLNLGTGSRSWWEANGPYCEPQYNVTAAVISYYEFRPISVQGCLLPFYAIETAQAAVHLLLTLFALVIGFYLLITFCTRQDDSCKLAVIEDVLS